MLAPEPSEAIVDSCKRGAEYFRAALMSGGLGPDGISAAFEGLAMALSVGDLEYDTMTSPWWFFLAAASRHSRDVKLIENAATEIWTWQCLEPPSQDALAAAFFVGVHGYIEHSGVPVSEYYAKHILPFVRQ